MKHFNIAISMALITLALSANASVFSDTLLLATNSDGDAAYQVANMYLTGTGTSVNREKAIKWLNAACEQGHPKAIAQLAILVQEKRKFTILEKLAEINDIDAQFALANAYANGVGISKDLERAKFWYEKASTVFPGNTREDTNKFDTNLIEENKYTDKGKVIDRNTVTAFISKKVESRTNTTKLNKHQNQIVLVPANSLHSTLLNSELLNLSDNPPPSSETLQSMNREQKIGDAQSIIIAGTSDNPNLTNLLQDFFNGATEKIKPETLDEKNIPLPKEAPPLPPMLPKPKTHIRSYNNESEFMDRSAPKHTMNTVNLGIEYLLGKNWTRNGKPATYLPSLLTQCQNNGGRIICNSHIIKEKHIARTIKYKTKAFITNIDGNNFHITYRNLFLGTISDSTKSGTEITDDDEFGNINSSQIFNAKSGWTKPHYMECYYSAKTSIRCLKDGLHTIEITHRKY